MKTTSTPLAIPAVGALLAILLACCKPAADQSTTGAKEEPPTVEDIVCFTDDKGAMKAGGDPTWFWSKTKNTFRVRFLDGETKVQDQVMKDAAEWTKHANVKFIKVDQNPSDIRISLTQGFHRSEIGKIAETAAANAFTMSLKPSSSLFGKKVPRAKVLHEFGHALGLFHEHQHPATPIKWNRNVVIAAMAGPPNHWPAEQTEQNILIKYSGPWQGTSEPDPKSVMTYSFPASWTENGISYSENSELSDSDIRVIRLHYGYPQP